tara:strand:+ start:269 stop:610 length:342 start_codon:yes stop_codon:yes gene_type:complete
MESKKNIKTAKKAPGKKSPRKILKKQTDLEKSLSQLTEKKPFNPKLFTSLVEEFLGSFIVIGYTQNGEPVALTSAKTQQQVDALHTNLQRFISMFMAAGGAEPEPEPPDETDQ